MDLKRMRLQQLVNKDIHFYPQMKIHINRNEEDVINRYDSDEENEIFYETDGEEITKSNSNSGKFETKNPQDNLLHIPSSVPKFQEDNYCNDDKILQTAQKEPRSVNLTYSRTTDKKAKMTQFEKYEDDYIDESLISQAEGLTSLENFNEISDLLVNLEMKTTSDSSGSVIFLSNCLQFILKKISLMIHENSEEKTIPLLVHLFPNLVRISEKVIQCGMENLSITTTENLNLKNRLKVYTCAICDRMFELHLTHLPFSRDVIMPFDNILTLTLKFLVQSEFISSDSDTLKSHVKRIFDSMHSSLIKNVIHFSLDNIKDLFNISFMILKDQSLSHIFIQAIDIICAIIGSVNGSSFIEKFIENMLLCYDDFLVKSDYSNEDFKYYLLDRKVITSYRSYFGVYKCMNGDTISMFTVLFLRFFSILYEDQYNHMDTTATTTSGFIPIFEKFLFKIFEWNRPNILLAIYCLCNDLIINKYNTEFIVTLEIMTNMFLSFSTLVAQVDLELNKRKFFIGMMDVLLSSLLDDFSKMKMFYLCLGESYNTTTTPENNKQYKKKRGNNKNKQSQIHTDITNLPGNSICNCFSCCFANNEIKAKNLFFACTLCKCKTNLRLQMIDPDKDDNASICGFCNMNHYFNSFESGLFKDNEMKLIYTNEEIIGELSKNKERLMNEDNEKKTLLNNADEFFEKFLLYQDCLYKNSFLFLKTSLLNFLSLTHKNEIREFSSNLDRSVGIFLKILISDQKLNIPIYKDFSENILRFYQIQKERLYNLQQDIIVDENTINYFLFYYFYVNILFAGHWRLIDLLLNDKSTWIIRYKSLKLLEKFLIFEGESVIFLNFSTDLIGQLLCDSSFNVREYSFEILFKLYKNKKIDRGMLICTLYEHINDQSFIIRKRIIKELIGLVIEEKERENLKTITLIFLNKLSDTSESDKIKHLIFNFYFQVFKKTSTENELLCRQVDVFIEILSENEDANSGGNFIYDKIRNVLSSVIEVKNLNDASLGFITDYVFSQYIFPLCTSSSKNPGLIHPLNLIKMISAHNSQNINIYIDTVTDFLKMEITITAKRNIDEDEVRHDNKIKQLACEILGNVLEDKNEVNLKTRIITLIENYLILIILNKPSFIMISAIDTYFKMLVRGMVDTEKIHRLTLQNYQFLQRNFQCGKKNLVEVPPVIIGKSLTLLSYIVYCSNIDQMLDIFKFLTKDISADTAEEIENFISDTVFDIYHFYSIRHPDATVRFRAFEALGFFWIKYPRYLNKSQDIIQNIIGSLSTDEEKLILLRTFNNFFRKISDKIKDITAKPTIPNDETEPTSDLGVIHLFFEKFINRLSLFLIEERSVIIRTHAMCLLKLIIELGNLNVHNILPQIFAALFDSHNDIRFNAVYLIEKIARISKEKFVNLIKDCLKTSFYFQKRHYVEQSLINSYVKVKSVGDSNNSYLNTSENVFEMFNYKISKIFNDANSFNRKILSKFLSAFQEIKTIEGAITTSNSHSNAIQDILIQMEFYEYVATMIGDFTFSKQSDVVLVFLSLYKEFETDFFVFSAKLKEYKKCENPEKMDIKFLVLYLITTVKIALFKYILLKFEFLDQNFENLLLKGWDTNLAETEGEGFQEKKIKKLCNNPLMIAKEFKCIKFHEFFSSFSLYIKDVLKFQNKSAKSFKHRDKESIVTLLKKLKWVFKTNPKEIRATFGRAKKKLNKTEDDQISNTIYAILFPNLNTTANDKSSSLSLASSRASSKAKVTLKIPNEKRKKRISLEEIKDSFDSDNDTKNIMVGKEKHVQRSKKKENHNKRRKTAVR